MGNPFTAVIAGGFSAGNNSEKGATWAYLKSREAAYNDEPIVGNHFDFLLADAKALLGPSYFLTHLQQQFGSQAVYK